MFAGDQGSGGRFSFHAALALTALLLAFSSVATAQRHGGSPSAGGGGLSSYSRPDGVSEGDTLKDFHQALAVQATSVQVADFQAIVKLTDAAKSELQNFSQKAAKGNVSRDTALDQAIDAASSASRKFQDGFSDAQKSGLRDALRRFARAGSDLDQETKRLDQTLDAKAPASDVTAHSESLEKALEEFSASQSSLAREMSIVTATGQDLTFLLPQVKTPIARDGSISVTVSGALLQTSSQAGQRTFNIELITDLSDVQQNATALMRARLDTGAECGERIAIQRATLMPDTPSSVVNLQLHYERWSCSQMMGQRMSNELAEGDGSVDIKVTPVVETPGALKFTAEIGKIDANGVLADSLRSGPLGDDLRGKVARTLVLAARSGLDFKIALPPAVQNSATVQTARFQDMGAGYLRVILTGQMQISNEQADALASQLNQTLSAQGSVR